MKITAVENIFSGTNLFVKISTDCHITGYGEATLNTRCRPVAAVITDLKEVLIGQDPFRTEHIFQNIFRGTFWRGGPILLAALSGIDLALWDIKGKALRTPVYNLLGGKCRDKIKLYTSVGGNSIDELKRSIDRGLEQGYNTYRICPTDGSYSKTQSYIPADVLETTYQYVKTLREKIATTDEIILENHTRPSPSLCIRIAKAVEEFNILFIEDAIRADSTESYRLLRNQITVSLGTGEKLGAIWDYKTLIEEDLIDFIRMDLCNGGGITQYKKIATMAEAHYIEMVPHFLSTPIGMLGVLHCDISTSNFYVQEGIIRNPNNIFKTDTYIKDGHAFLSDGIGLGFELDESKIEPFRQYEHPHNKRWDGSFQDW